MLSGNDSLILWTLLAGGKGAIAACANVFPHTMVSIYEKFAAAAEEEEEEEDRKWEREARLEKTTRNERALENC